MKQHVWGSFHTPTRISLARVSMALSLGLTGAATLAAVPYAYAQQAAGDQSIAANVVKTIGTYPDLAGEHITATSQNGVVTLNGTATSQTAKDQAQVVAATVDGVNSVVNDIAVVGGGQPASADPANSGPQQASSGDASQQQAPYNPQQQPDPGAQGDWGQAGPPPDADSGHIPQQPQNDASGNNQPNPGQYPAQPPAGQPGYGQPQPGYGQPQGGYGQYPGQSSGQYPGQYPGARPSYGPPSQYPQPDSAPPRLATTPATIQAGALISVRTSEPLDSKHLQGGEIFQAVLAQDLFSGPYLAVPRGAVAQLQVVGVNKPGAVRGDAGFALRIVSLSLGGQSYPVSTDTFATDTRGKGGYTTSNTVGGAALGALIGAIAGGGPGAAIGAVAGGGVGLGASAASGGPRSVMPPETLLTFHLQAPLTVNPISMAEVQQLHASAPSPAPRPAQYGPPRRVYAPYPYGYYPPPPPPPPPYYPYAYWR